jgi:hypothetical protein
MADAKRMKIFGMQTVLLACSIKIRRIFAVLKFSGLFGFDSKMKGTVSMPS